MVFRPRQRRQTLDLSINIDKNNIECVKETVFLGVVLDEHLSWKPDIINVSRKISKSIGIIYKSSFCLPKTSLRSLYYTLVYPYLIYCVSVWGSTYHSNLKRIIILQKKIIRIISKDSFDSHTDVLFKEQMILKFPDIKKLKIVKVLVCLPKDLKRSFLFSHINPFKELPTCFLLVCFIVTFFLKYLIIYLHIQYPKFIVYPISVLRKPIVHKPAASI